MCTRTFKKTSFCTTYVVDTVWFCAPIQVAVLPSVLAHIEHCSALQSSRCVSTTSLPCLQHSASVSREAHKTCAVGLASTVRTSKRVTNCFQQQVLLMATMFSPLSVNVERQTAWIPIICDICLYISAHFLKFASWKQH